MPRSNATFDTGHQRHFWLILKILIEPSTSDLFNAKALQGRRTQSVAVWNAALGAAVCSLLLMLLGVLGANPAWHEALHQELHEAAAGNHDATVPASQESDSAHPGESCAVCAYLHQQVGGVVDAPAVVTVLEVTVLTGFPPPSEPVLADFRREPGSRGPPLGV